MVLDTDIRPETAGTKGNLLSVPIVRQWNSIGFKIMLANTIALLALGLGMVIFSKYHRVVVYTELSLLESEAKMWAAYLSEASLDQMKEKIDRLVTVNKRSATLFDAQGHVLSEYDVSKNSASLDDLSSITEDRSRPVAAEPLARFLLTIFPVTYDLPPYRGGTGANLSDYGAGLPQHPAGIHLNAWTNSENRLIFTATVPIRFSAKEAGTLLIVKNTTETDEAFQMVRLDIARVLLSALAITLALTLYVAFMVARPLNRLAQAARAIGSNKKTEFPDLSDRGDEIGALSLVLNQTTRALHTRMDSIERFAADVAHELKNPLTSLRSAIETLSKIQDPEKRQKLMSIMTEDTQRLDRLITDISRLSRLDSELARQPRVAMDLCTILIQVLRGHAAPETFFARDLPHQIQVSGRNITISLDIPEGLPPVMGYPGRFEQVLGNLIGNAVSFSPPKGEIRLCARRQADVIRFYVDDEGSGIPEGRLDTIFNRFYTERPASEAFGTHSGLGLSIARHIVESSGGRIWAENRMSPDGTILGARFVVELLVSI